MTDIVERLRTWNDGVWLEHGPNLLHDAADEIERLRKECSDYVLKNAALQGELAKLRRAAP